MEPVVAQEIMAAIGWLNNLLADRENPSLEDLTLKEALEGAGEWAHETWENYG